LNEVYAETRNFIPLFLPLREFETVALGFARLDEKAEFAGI
jgi:hypothetical protein